MTRPELTGTFGMVASTHWLASAAGMSVLERGGNAFDAAVAAGFTLQVVEPHMNGPGGEMPAIVYSAQRKEVQVVCGQGPAPGAATPERFREMGLDTLPGSGLPAACVPGAVGGWLLMLRDFGTWPLEEVLAFAIAYAEDGFPLVRRAVEGIAAVESEMRRAWPHSAAIWLPSGRLPAAGERFRNPQLAETYRRLLREAASAGRDRDERIEGARTAWYEGFVAEAIDNHLRTAPPSEGGPGLLTGADMARWRAGLEPSLAHGYGPWRVHKTGPWGQGPVFLQQLALLSAVDLPSMPVGGPDFIHAAVESAKLAFADREAWYGDPAFAPDLTGELLAEDYTRARRRLMGEEASSELRPGSPGGRDPRIPWRFATSAAEGPGLGDPDTETYRPQSRPGDTCHVDVVDRWGNMVSATPSGGWLQSSPAIPGLGFCLGTRVQIFNLEPGHPNTLEPGKRPRTTLSPSLAEREDGFRLAFGTPGADQQDQWSFNFFVQLVSGGWNLQEAIDAPMWHTDHFPRSFHPHQSRPGSLIVEDRVGEKTITELRRRGHDLEVLPGWSSGRLSAVADDRPRGLVRAAANPRHMQGYAAGR
jgi:gamma-glutamyltranspeptidase / glutathione hydrolase